MGTIASRFLGVKEHTGWDFRSQFLAQSGTVEWPKDVVQGIELKLNSRNALQTASGYFERLADCSRV